MAFSSLSLSQSSTFIIKSTVVLFSAIALKLVYPSMEHHPGSSCLETERSAGLEMCVVNSLSHEELAIKRSDFPSDFLFGAASSAVQVRIEKNAIHVCMYVYTFLVQVEGAAKQGGRGPSIWDNFVEDFPEKIADKSNTDTCIDSYNRYKEDVKALKSLGVDSYRFSISWTRILPEGYLRGGINQEGIDYYNNLINELIRNGIKPCVTLFHFDSPQDLQDKFGGFLCHSIMKDFKDYCEICFRSFGDRIKHWITINEPLIIALFGYDMGLAAPGRCSQPVGACPAGNSSREPYIVSHNLLLSHAVAARLYKEKFQAKQGGEIGITLVGQFFEPYSESSAEDLAAVERALDFYLGWYMDPLTKGDYPLSMRNLVKKRLPSFTEKQKKIIMGSFDFIGFIYYTSRYVRSIPIDPHVLPTSFVRDSFVDLKVEKAGKLTGEKAEGSSFIYAYPQGLQKLLEYVKENYYDPKIYITDNGINELRNDSRPLDKSLKDQHRIDFVLRHLYRIHNAIRNGANVKGYFHWSLCDSFEFGDGFNLRYGLHYIDYKNNLKRIPKQSVQWLKGFLHGQN